MITRKTKTYIERVSDIPKKHHTDLFYFQSIDPPIFPPNKNIETCVQIWNVLTELGADRKSLVINLGGGVVTDLGGFVASTFKRGVDFIHIPTTLLSMVDASVGGKNGVDLGNLKNQIGVINVPMMVIIDTQYLQTVPQNEMRSGLAEMLKHGLIYDKKYWEQFLDLKAIDFAVISDIV